MQKQQRSGQVSLQEDYTIKNRLLLDTRLLKRLAKYKMHEQASVELAQVQLVLRKLEMTDRMIERELEQFNNQLLKKRQDIAQTIDEIEQLKQDLQAAQTEREHWIEYDAIAKQCEKYPSRSKSAVYSY
jgi:phage shock protein A